LGSTAFSKAKDAMAETTSDQEQQKKPQQASEPAGPQPGIEAPQPEWDGSAPAVSLGPGLGSPDGFEQRAADARQQKNANRQQRVQTVTAMQRQFGNQHVQRFMVQRQSATAFAPVQRQNGGQAEPQGDKDKADAGNITIDEKGVTTAVYNPPSMVTKNEVPTPSADAKPGEDKVDVTATVVATFKVTTSVSLPSVPGGLTACQAKRVRDAINNQLKPHEDQHVAAMKQFDGTFETTVTVKGVSRAAAPAALIAAAKPAVDAEGATRKKTAQDASDALDQPPFMITVDLNCEDEKPGKKQSQEAPATPSTNELPPSQGGESTPL
jgi:hypothetical protein